MSDAKPYPKSQQLARGERRYRRKVASPKQWRDAMGDDGTGHCRGCGQPIERINPDCPVCYRALCAFMDEEVDSNGEPF